MLTTEEYETLPEKAQAAFVLDGEEYVTAKDAKLKDTLYHITKERDEFKTKLGTSETEHQTAIETARVEAREKALEEALKSGDSEAAEQLREEKVLDRIKRAQEESKLEANKEFKLQLTTKEAANQVAQIVNDLHPMNDKAKKSLAILVKQGQSISEDGEIIYLNDDGSASSLDAKGYVSEALKNGSFDGLIKPDHIVSGGGNINGSRDASGSKVRSKMSANDKASYINEHGQDAFLKLPK